MRHLCILFALLCVAAVPTSVELNLDKPSCAPLITQQERFLEGTCVTRIKDAEIKKDAIIAGLKARIAQLRAGGKAILAECTANYFVRSEQSGAHGDKQGGVHIYLREATVCGDYGILRFEIAQLLEKQRYKLARVEVTPPDGLPTTQAVLRMNVDASGVLIASAVFDVAVADDDNTKFSFRFIGTNGESIFVSGVSFPLARIHGVN